MFTKWWRNDRSLGINHMSVGSSTTCCHTQDRRESEKERDGDEENRITDTLDAYAKISDLIRTGFRCRFFFCRCLFLFLFHVSPLQDIDRSFRCWCTYDGWIDAHSHRNQHNQRINNLHTSFAFARKAIDDDAAANIFGIRCFARAWNREFVKTGFVHSDRHVVHEMHTIKLIGVSDGPQKRQTGLRSVELPTGKKFKT